MAGPVSSEKSAHRNRGPNAVGSHLQIVSKKNRGEGFLPHPGVVYLLMLQCRAKRLASPRQLDEAIECLRMVRDRSGPTAFKALASSQAGIEPSVCHPSKVFRLIAGYKRHTRDRTRVYDEERVGLRVHGQKETSGQKCRDASRPTKNAGKEQGTPCAIRPRRQVCAAASGRPAGFARVVGALF